MEKLKKEIKSIKFDYILDKMGFPKNYKKIKNIK